MRKILQSAMLSKNYEFNEGESRFQKKQTKKIFSTLSQFQIQGLLNWSNMVLEGCKLKKKKQEQIRGKDRDSSLAI